jgi:hypothetical protein
MRQMPLTYILDGQEPVPCDDPHAVELLLRDIGSRQVATTRIKHGKLEILISTVFLCIDHQFGEGPPHLFETMVFLDGDGGYCERCSTWLEAQFQHDRVADMVRRGEVRPGGVRILEEGEAR